MNRDVILTDGATGTCLWDRVEEKKAVWHYNMECPDVVRGLHEDYIKAGSDFIFSNTFGANGPSVAPSGYSVEDVVRAGVRIAKEAVAGTNVKVALDIGPLSELLEPYGELTEEEAEQYYIEQIGSGMKENPDMIVLETFFDASMLAIAAKVARNYDVPLLCSMTFETKGKSIMGHSPERMMEEIEPYSPDIIGLNCSLEPLEAIDLLKNFLDMTKVPLFLKPNAGKPGTDDSGEMLKMDAESFARDIVTFPEGRKLYIGGCCGSDPEYIACIRRNLNA